MDRKLFQDVIFDEKQKLKSNSIFHIVNFEAL